MPLAKQLRVLVADDTVTSRMLVCNSLQELGIVNIEIAKDGQEALTSMKASPCHLVLSDLEMPQMNGLQLLKSLREHAPTRSTGFILVTGKGDRTTIEEGRKFGLNNYLSKPFDTAKMRACLEAVIGKIT